MQTQVQTWPLRPFTLYVCPVCCLTLLECNYPGVTGRQVVQPSPIMWGGDIRRCYPPIHQWCSNIMAHPKMARVHTNYTIDKDGPFE